jgi:periplasmic protein TonB
MRPIHGKGIKKSRWPGVVFVILFHVVAIWGLASGLANSTIQLLRGNLQTVVTTEEVKEDTPPPPPPPDFKPPPVVAIAPEVTIDLAQAPPPAATTAITNTPPKPPAPVAVAPPPPPPPPTPPQALNSHQITDAADYPAISLRLQEQGQVLIKYVVQANGTVSDCEVQKSSGKPRLDEGACNFAKKKWRFKAATQDGKPVAAALTANVVFQLK